MNPSSFKKENEQNRSEILDMILATLESQRFVTWYNSGNFDKYITGDLPKISKEQIKQEIETLFRLS